MNNEPRLCDIWSDSARRSPDRTAIVFEQKRISYRELMVRAGRFASAAFELGARSQDRVALLSRNRVEFIEIFAGCNTGGLIATSVNWRLAAPEVQFIVNDCTPRIFVFEQEFTALVESIKPGISGELYFICVGEKVPPWAVAYEEFLEPGRDDFDARPVRPDDIAHLLYTSGTTGRPKGVMRSQAAEMRGAESIALALQLEFGGRMLQIMPLFHIGALSVAHAQFFCQGTVVLHQGFEPRKALETIAEEKIDATLMAPTLINDIFNLPDFSDFDLTSLKTICYSAAPMPVSLLKEGLKRLGPVFVDCYGATESKVVTFLHKHRHMEVENPDVARRLGSVGQPTPGLKVRIVDECGNLCPRNRIGEICISGPTLMSGYWNNHEATVEAFRDGWFASGDMGYLDDQDYLFLVDRKKDMIISGGENIYCREVEEALITHPAVEDVAVIGVPDNRWGECVRAVVVLKPGEKVSEKDLIDFSRDCIAAYKCPKSIVFVEDFPRLPSGKTKKTELRERFGESYREP